MSRGPDGFESVSAGGEVRPRGAVADYLERKVERPFVAGRDGLCAFDAAGAVRWVRRAAVDVHEMNAPASGLDPVVRMLAHGNEARPVRCEMPGGLLLEGRTDDQGAFPLELSRLPEGAVDPRRGGLLQVSATTPHGAADTARVLALPRDYDGPVFVCDIDDTLRATRYADIARGRTAAPVEGARELLEAVAARGVPIVYLSAASARLQPANDAFLAQLPPGALLDWQGTGVKALAPSNRYQAARQGKYKAAVLEELRSTFPGVQLFGLGDDKYGDAIAYTRVGARAFIRDVRPGDANLPADFRGTVVSAYTAEVIGQVGAALDEAISHSRSFGNGAPPGG